MDWRRNCVSFSIRLRLIPLAPDYPKYPNEPTSDAVTVTEGVALGVWGVSGKVVAVSGRLSPFCVGVGGVLLPVEGLGGVTVPGITNDWFSGRGEDRPLFVGDAGDGGIRESMPLLGPPFPLESGRLSGDADLWK